VRRSRRLVAMTTAGAAVLGLGFVVSVASHSLPGGEESDLRFDMDFALDVDLSPILAWILLLLAVVGAVLFALGIGQARPRQDGRRRNSLALVIGLLVFIALYRWLRPAAEAILGEPQTTTETVEDVPAGGAGAAGGWLFTVLLAAVIAATLTRIGLSIHSAGLPFQVEARVATPVHAPRRRVASGALALGTDPRSRVLDAYHDFEEHLAAVGEPRPEHETTGRHARRMVGRFGLDSQLVETLVEKHLAARYDVNEPIEADAVSAEESSTRLQRDLPR
jgi:hypothetical protein